MAIDFAEAFSLSSQAEAIQRSTISRSRYRVTFARGREWHVRLRFIREQHCAWRTSQSQQQRLYGRNRK